MDEKEILKKVDRKILEANLIISERRLKFVIGLGAAILAILDVLLPIWLTSQSTSKIDNTIKTMQERFAKFEFSLPEYENQQTIIIAFEFLFKISFVLKTQLVDFSFSVDNLKTSISLLTN